MASALPITTARNVTIHTASSQKTLEPLRLSLLYLDGSELHERLAAFEGLYPQALRIARDNPKLHISALEMLYTTLVRELTPFRDELQSAALPVSAAFRESLTTASRVLLRLAQDLAKPAEEFIKSRTAQSQFSKEEAALYLSIATLELMAQIVHAVHGNLPKDVWPLLYKNFKIAYTRDHHRHPMPEGEDTIERAFARLLLLTLSDSAKWAPGDGARLSKYLLRMAPLARVTDRAYISDTAAAFVIGARGVRPEILRKEELANGKETSSLMVDLSEINATLEAQLMTFAQGFAPSDLQLQEGEDGQAWLSLLERCRAFWTGNRRRRFERKAYLPRVDVAFGMHAVWQFLAGGAFRRRTGDPAMPGETTLSEWAVVDQSAGGFALRLLQDDAQQPKVGDLIAIRFRDHSIVYYGVIRRVSFRDLKHLELGMETIANRAAPVTLHTRRGQRAGDKALLVPSMPGRSATPALIFDSRSENFPASGELEMPQGRKVVAIGDMLLRSGTLTALNVTLGPAV